VVSGAGVEREKEGVAECPAIPIFLTMFQQQHGECGKVRLNVDQAGANRLCTF